MVIIIRDHYYIAKLLKKTLSGKVGISHWISRQIISNKFVRKKMRPKEMQREICQILSDLSDLQV